MCGKLLPLSELGFPISQEDNLPQLCEGGGRCSSCENPLVSEVLRIAICQLWRGVGRSLQLKMDVEGEQQEVLLLASKTSLPLAVLQGSLAPAHMGSWHLSPPLHGLPVRDIEILQAGRFQLAEVSRRTPPPKAEPSSIRPPALSLGQAPFIESEESSETGWSGIRGETPNSTQRLFACSLNALTASCCLQADG